MEIHKGRLRTVMTKLDTLQWKINQYMVANFQGRVARQTKAAIIPTKCGRPGYR